MATRTEDTERLLEALMDPILMVDAERRVVAANAAARRLFATDPAGRNIALSVRHPAVLDALDRVLEAEAAPSREVEVTLAAPVPTAYLVRVSAFSTRDGARAGRALVAFHDVTATQQAERMRADFVANVSHELRSPLTTLLGFIETLRGPAREDAAARERFLEVMHAEARRMAHLIGDLLSLSRVEAEEHVPPRGAVDARHLLEEIARNLHLRAAGRGMKIEIDAPAELPPALGDREELMLVFRNLIDNAIGYGRAGTPIAVGLRAVERIPGTGQPGLAVAVRDRGEGIAAEHIPRLTERFYRVDKGRSRSVGGTGLGLAIVKHVVSRHRGRLVVESTPGEGSTFTVFLPRAEG